MKEKLRIGMIVPDSVSLPPTNVPKGGSAAIEWNAYEITEGLVRRGHDVTLFANGDSKTSAKLESIVPINVCQDYKMESYWPKPGLDKMIEHDLTLLSHAYSMAKAGKFDIMHSHVPTRSSLFTSLVDIPTVATLHSPLHLEVDRMLLRKGSQYHVSISDDQRNLAPDLNYFRTIPHGINLDNFLFSDDPGDFLIYVGRIAPEKGVEKAIQIAKRAGEKLLLIGSPFLEADGDYWEEEIRPHIDGENVIHHEFMDRDKVQNYVLKAKASLFPIRWSEPFGYTMIESMAAGTPVIAYSRGSVPEVIIDGNTGFVVEADNLEEMSRAVKRVSQIDRRACRQHVEDNFTLDIEIDRYVEVYRSVLERESFETKRYLIP